MLIDLLIIALIISAIYRGREIGFIRQLFATIGFFAGLFLGAWLQQYALHFFRTENSRFVIGLTITIGVALVGLTIGEYAGMRLKHKVVVHRVNKYDNILGAFLAIVAVLFTAWLVAAILITLPYDNLRTSIDRSRIIQGLNKVLPDAPQLIDNFGNLIDPNGFPQVFIGDEPVPSSQYVLPNLGSLQSAVDKDRASVVKIKGRGCGGYVEGSGFVVGANLVATNAHVVAGIWRPYVHDANGTHGVAVIWFDPDLDFAVLRVSNLAGKSLVLDKNIAANGTATAVLGYPGGGDFSAKPSVIQSQFNASGRNIYGKGNTLRQVYELHAQIIPGNSGGPVITQNGSVIGMVFAESTTYQQVGYAITASKIANELNQAVARNKIVSTGSCAE